MPTLNKLQHALHFLARHRKHSKIEVYKAYTIFYIARLLGLSWLSWTLRFKVVDRNRFSVWLGWNMDLTGLPARWGQQEQCRFQWLVCNPYAPLNSHGLILLFVWAKNATVQTASIFEMLSCFCSWRAFHPDSPDSILPYFVAVFCVHIAWSLQSLQVRSPDGVRWLPSAGLLRLAETKAAEPGRQADMTQTSSNAAKLKGLAIFLNFLGAEAVLRQVQSLLFLDLSREAEDGCLWLCLLSHQGHKHSLVTVCLVYYICSCTCLHLFAHAFCSFAVFGFCSSSSQVMTLLVVATALVCACLYPTGWPFDVSFFAAFGARQEMQKSHSILLHRPNIESLSFL